MLFVQGLMYIELGMVACWTGGLNKGIASDKGCPTTTTTTTTTTNALN